MIDNGQWAAHRGLLTVHVIVIKKCVVSSHHDNNITPPPHSRFTMTEKLTGPCFVRWWWHLSPPGSVVTGQSEVLNQRVNTVYVGTGYQQSGCAPPGQVSSHFRWWRPRVGQECPSSSHWARWLYLHFITIIITMSPLSSSS